MLNLSKYRHAIVGCGAIATVACIGLLQSGSASAQSATTNNSNSGGGNVTTIPSVSVVGGSGGGSNPGGSTSAIGGRASTISSRVSVAQTNYNTAASNLSAAETAQPVAANTTPVRYAVEKGVADVASCGCPNADTVSSAPSTTPRPELVAAKSAEADAAAELAAAQAEARQFIESVKSGTTATSSPANSQLW